MWYNISDSISLFFLFFSFCYTKYLVPQVEYDLAPKDEGNFVRQISLVLIPDLTLIGNSPIYSVSADGVTGTLRFCVRLEVFTQDNTTRVNWR